MGPEAWGDAISWFPNFAARRVVGWMPRRPEQGDVLRVAMKSDKVLLCEFIDVESDPADMFFATVRDIGYEGEEASC